MSQHPGSVILAEHNGFCGGVQAADQLLAHVTDVAQAAGIDEVYGLHHIVHNDDVTRFHENRGVRFVEEIDDIPPNQLVVTSAHGVGPRVEYELEQNGATHFSAACFLVKHTHNGVKFARRDGATVLYVSHDKPDGVTKPHDEVLGMIGHLDDERLPDGSIRYNPVERRFLALGEEPSAEILAAGGLYRVITQTTLIATKALAYREQLKQFIESQQPGSRVDYSTANDVCRAVEDRQESVRQLVSIRPRRIVVVTDPTSSNGKSYVDLAKNLTENDDEVSVHAVANAAEAAELGLADGVTGLTASASTPDRIIREVASELGEDALPPFERKAFRLDDNRPGVVELKVQAHAERLRAA